MPVLKQNDIFAGRYLLNRLIGEGGFSEVWRAEDLMADDAVVAIKIYAPNGGLDDDSLRQSRNEFSLTHNLSHPHLLKVNHFDVADGSPYLIMTYCPYGSLAHVLRREGAFSEKQVALVMCQIGSALEEVHGQQPSIIHQDIKPDNILLLNPESFMLADFGISSRIRHTLRKTKAQAQALTISYAAPERFSRHPTADPTSDIFSLGVTMYEMCTNLVPWDGAGGQCLLKGASVPALPNTFSAELGAILDACMSVEPGKRPTAAELHALGKRFLETGHWHQPKQEKPVVKRKKALSPSLTAAMVVVVLIALAGFGFYKEQAIELATDNGAKITTAFPVENKNFVTAVKYSSPPKETPEVKAKAKEPQAIKKYEAVRPEKPKQKTVRVEQVAQQNRSAVLQPELPVRSVTIEEPVLKETEATEISKKTTPSRPKTNATVAKKPSKAKKPLFNNSKAKKNQKWKPKKKWLVKLKRKLGS